MFTRVKSAAELDAMRESGAMLATVLNVLRQKLQPGQSAKDLAEIAKQELKALGGQPTFLGYYGFPDVLCVSINDEVVHGIPRAERIIRNGDVVSMDFGVTHRGMITDAAITCIAGSVTDKRSAELVAVTEAALDAGIAALHGGVPIGDVAASIQAVLDDGGLGIVRDLVGHGVGHHLHEEPNIPNLGKPGTGPRLEAGMTVALEPMATLGGWRVTTDNDGWTIRTADGSLAAHFEHTVLITEEGFEILTKVR